MTVVATFRFSNPSTLTLWIEVLRVKLGEADATIAEVTKVAREAQRVEGNIAVKEVKVVETSGPQDLGLNSLPVLPIAQSQIT